MQEEWVEWKSGEMRRTGKVGVGQSRPSMNTHLVPSLASTVVLLNVGLKLDNDEPLAA